ncbi:hypothetical protein EDB19DRAFT_2020485 [Suillus lakei]|nr:hypothetical protein EDB19DRAFT_2020485 [Suillus lakei]
MISTAMTITARVAVTGFLTVSCFKRTVVDNTAQVLSEAEKVTAGLVAYSVCFCSEILSNDAKYMPAAPKDDAADFNPPSSNANAASTTPKPVEPYHLQPSPSLSPSSLRLIESTETISAPITCCICTPCTNLNLPNLCSKRLSIDSNTTLVPHSDDFVPDAFLNDVSDTDNCDSFDDESTVHKDDRCKPQPRKEPALEPPTLDILIAKTTTLNDPPRPCKLRPLVLVTNRNTTSTIAYRPLPKPAYSMDALARSMEALSLSDRPPSTSKLKPLVLVTKRAIGQLKDPPPITTPFRQPTTDR